MQYQLFSGLKSAGKTLHSLGLPASITVWASCLKYILSVHRGTVSSVCKLWVTQKCKIWNKVKIWNLQILSRKSLNTKWAKEESDGWQVLEVCVYELAAHVNWFNNGGTPVGDFSCAPLWLQPKRVFLSFCVCFVFVAAVTSPFGDVQNRTSLRSKG